MSLNLTWNGTSVTAGDGDWVWSLWGQPEFGGFDWPVATQEHAGWGASQLGIGTPGPRTVNFAIRAQHGSPDDIADNLLDAQRAEAIVLSRMYAPSLGECALDVATTDTTRRLYGRRPMSSSWRRALQAGEAGLRPARGGPIVYPVTLVCPYPWFIQDEDSITGNHTGCSGTAAAGDYACGWRLVITAGTGQTAAPSITVTIDGVALDFDWADKTVWSGGVPTTSSIAWDGGDVVVLEAFWPHGQSRLGVVSYIREEGSTTNLRDYGVLVPDIAGLTRWPTIPADGGSVSVALSSMVSGSTCSFDYATLHENP